MKKSLFICGFIIFEMAGVTSAAIALDADWTVNTAIPDGSPVGIAASETFQNLMSGPITSVDVDLNISGGYNGDLYAYLAGPNGGVAVLLNRTGVTAGNSFGYADSGFNVTFDDSAANGIHLYQPISNPNGGILTGTWQPDGENLDPQSAPSAFTGAQTALLGSLNGNDPNGTWTLFLADLSAGGQANLISWQLDITAIPEPAATTLAALGGLALLVLRHSKQRRL